MLLKESSNDKLKEAALILEQHYGIIGELKRLQGEVDENYYVHTNDGDYTFKISAPDATIDEVEFQTAVLKHVNQSTSLLLPKVIPTIEGKGFKVISVDNENRVIRLLTWVDGKMYAHVNPHSSQLLRSVGQSVAEMTRLFKGFEHARAHRNYKWDPAQTDWIKNHIDAFNDKKDRELIIKFYEIYNQNSDLFSTLPKSVTHNDINDYNLVVRNDNSVVEGVIDFGDAIYTYTICELAILLAYAMMDKKEPLKVAAKIIAGYHEKIPLQENEVKALFSLVAARLMITITSSLINKKLHPENEYLLISERPAWDLLRKLGDIDPNYAHYSFRAACGWSPNPTSIAIENFISKSGGFHKVVDVNYSENNLHWLDLSVGSIELGGNANFENTRVFTTHVQRIIEDNNATVGMGKYNEVRPIYTTDAYSHETDDGPQWRTVHIGLDWFVQDGTNVLAALDGTIHQIGYNYNGKDYGPTLILKHEIENIEFYTLYGHLSKASVDKIEVGQLMKKGEVIAKVGSNAENGDWPPHLHFQLITDLLNHEGDFPGVAFPYELEIWKSLSPDPTMHFGLEEPIIKSHNSDSILEKRKSKLGRSLSISYHEPLYMVRGNMQYLYDANGRRYLDMVNNVPHVGHENHRVVKAGQKQMSVLNTNTRYLHDNIVNLAEELLSTMPQHLSVCHFVNSGSEANELALRMARNFTGGRDMVVMETGYHGNTNACIEISSYKFDGKGGKGAPSHIHVVPTPDQYRGQFVGQGEEVYVQFVKDALKNIEAKGEKLAGFIAESILSCAGQVPLPTLFLQKTYQLINEAGGLCIADEVQTGIGRVGDKFWAFELQDVKPDIVTIGKPLGNGHPIAAVVTTAEVADRFANGMEYFNTFGGNPVSCAIAIEVLRTVKEESLQELAREVGNELMDGLRNLQAQYPIIGDVRGYGFFSGFELVREVKGVLIPAADEASYLSNRMRDKGILISTDGPDYNVLKLKPPMCIDKYNVSFFLEQLEIVLKEDFLT